MSISELNGRASNLGVWILPDFFFFGVGGAGGGGRETRGKEKGRGCSKYK